MGFNRRGFDYISITAIITTITFSFIAKISSMDVELSTIPFIHCPGIATANITVTKSGGDTDVYFYELNVGGGIYTETGILKPRTNLYARTCELGCYKANLIIHGSSETQRWNFTDVCIVEVLDSVDLLAFSSYNRDTPTEVLPNAATLIFEASLNVSRKSISRCHWIFQVSELWVPLIATTTNSTYSVTEYPASIWCAVNVSVENQFYLVDEFINVTMIEDVGRSLSLTTSGPVQLGQVTLFEYSTDRLPTDAVASFVVDLGDGNSTELYDFVEVTEDSGSRFKFSFSYMYQDVGSYAVTVTASTEASSISISEVVHCLTISLLSYLPNGEVLSESDTGETFESPIIFNVTISDPVPFSVVKYIKWTVAGGYTERMVTDTPSLQHVFQKAGDFHVTATAVSHNGVDVTNATVTLRVIDSIAAVYLINDSPSAVGGMVTFILFTSRIGTEASYTADLGDGTTLQLGEPIMELNVVNHIPPSLNLIFDPTKMFSVTFHHTYTSERTFTASVSALNEISHRTAHTDVFVLAKACPLPVVLVDKNEKLHIYLASFTSKMIVEQAAKVRVDSCYSSRKIALEWTAHTIKNLTMLPDSSNQHPLPSQIDTSRTNLVITPHVFSPGTYALKLSVSVLDQHTAIPLVYNSDQTYVKISRPRLVAKIKGGASRALGWTSEVTIDASESFDPDETDSNALQYMWYCRVQDDAPFPDPVSLSHSAKTGGCFGDGIYLPDHNGPSLSLSQGSLDTLVPYVFRLEVHKPSRLEGKAEQIIELVPGSPPVLYLRCLYNCDGKVNPSEKFALSVNCVDCSASSSKRYVWGLYDSGGGRVTDLDLKEHSTTGVEGSGKTLILKPYALANLTAQTHTLKVSVSVSGRTEGIAEYAFKVNSLPIVGSCSVTPQFGNVLDTRYTVSCNGFSDDDRPLTYEFVAFTGVEEKATVNFVETGQGIGTSVYFGQKPGIESAFLPVGMSERGYRVDIVVTVSDMYGAYVQVVTSTIVTDTEEEPGVICEQLFGLLSGEESPLKSALEFQDTRMTTQLLSMVSSVLNAQTKKVSAFNDIETKSFTSFVNKKIRSTIIHSLSEMPVDSVQMVRQVASGMKLATHEKAEVAEYEQLVAVDMCAKMARILKSMSGQTTERAVTATALTLASCLSNTVETVGSVVTTSASFHDSATFGDTASIKSCLANLVVLQNVAENEMADAQGHNMTQRIFMAVEDLQSALSMKKASGEPATTLITPIMVITLERRDAETLDGSSYQDAEYGFGYRFPENSSLSRLLPENHNDAVDLQSFYMPENPVIWDSSDRNIRDAIMGFQIKLPPDLEVKAENLSAEIEIFIPQDPLVSTNRIIEIDNLNTSRLQTKFTIDKPGKSVLLGVETNEMDLTFQLYVQYKDKPSSEEFDDTIILPDEDGGCYTTLDSETNPCFWFLSSEYLHRVGTYHVLVRVDGAFQSEGVSVGITMYSADCVYWDGDAGEWLTDGCRAGRLTTPSYTHCLCDHLTVFGGSMSVFENPVSIFEIQPSFTTILDNPVLLSAIVGLFAIYLMLAIWAVRQDRIDRARAKICVLEDNYPSATYYYDVTVHTGYRPGAGTSADVALTLCGVKGESEPHVLRSLTRKVLQRGETETFRLTTNQSLGKIEAVRLWHDDSGDHPSWFVGHIIVHELETNRSWYFSCNAWLATDTRSGQIDRVFKANKVDDLKKFKHLFVFKATKDIRDRHLWFGIFGRPTRSKFTRLQRISCVLSLILGTMMANVMLCWVLEEEFFRGMDAGKFHFSWRNPVIGMAGSVIVFPINLAIVQLFRCIESKAQEAKEGYSESDSLQYDSASSERTAVSSLSRRISLSASSGEISAESSGELSPQGSTQDSSTEWMDLNSEISFFRGSDTAITSATDTSSVVVADEYIFLSLNQVRDDCKDDLLATDDVSVVDQYTNLDLNLDILLKLTGMEERPEASALVEVDDTVILTGGKRPFQIVLPSNFVYVGWFVVAATVLISAYYALLYGLKHGKEQSAYWLVTVCVSIFQSVFLEQPALVFFSAIFFALFIKDVVDDDVPDGDVDGVDSPLPAVYFDSLDMATEHVSRLRQGAIYSPPKPLEERGAALSITVEGGRSLSGGDLENDEAAERDDEKNA